MAKCRYCANPPEPNSLLCVACGVDKAAREAYDDECPDCDCTAYNPCDNSDCPHHD